MSKETPPYIGTYFTGADSLHHDLYPAISAASTASLQQPRKVVLVTGAGRGIGRATAIEYAHAGVSSIILVSRTLSQLEETESEISKINPKIKVHKFALDVTDDEAVQSCASSIKAQEGRLDVLINNAATSTKWLPIVASDAKGWWNTFEVNVKGPFLFLHALLPLLNHTAEEFKTNVHVINMVSVGAHRVHPVGSAYNTTKLALMRLTEFVDVEHRDKGVTAVALHPGGVLTDFSKQEFDIIGPFLVDTAALAGGFSVWVTAEPRTWLGGRYLAASWDVEKLESMKEEIVENDKLKMRMTV